MDVVCLRTQKSQTLWNSCLQPVAFHQCWSISLCHSPVSFRAHSRSLPLTLARADAGISTGKWQKPKYLVNSVTHRHLQWPVVSISAFNGDFFSDFSESLNFPSLTDYHFSRQKSSTWYHHKTDHDASWHPFLVLLCTFINGYSIRHMVSILWFWDNESVISDTIIMLSWLRYNQERNYISFIFSRFV